jgi:hypothetical protein
LPDSNSYDVRVIRGTDFYQIITLRIKSFNLSADFYAGKDILLLQEQDMNMAMLTTTSNAMLIVRSRLAPQFY